MREAYVEAPGGQRPPAVQMQAHSAPLGLTFVASPAFPAALQGDLLVAFHGAWNRSEPTGYKVVRLPFRDGQPTGQVEDFLTGFQTAAGVWSRPVDAVFGPDGALYVTAGGGGAIFRIAPAVASP
jgi:glucose/arabinose dehydrogenase